MAILTGLLALSTAGQRAITSIDPPSAQPGERVTISGRGLAEVTEVRFDGVPARFEPVSDSCLIAVIPSGATPGPVILYSRQQESAPFRYRVQPAYWDDFEFPDQSPRPQIEFMRFRRPDGTRVAYFAAGDRYLETAFAFLDRYWGPLPDRADTPRGFAKAYLPRALKSLGHEPSVALMRHFATSFFEGQDPETKLVAFDPSSWKSYARERRGGGLTGYQVTQVSDHFLRWFPDDPDLLARSAALARAMVRSFDACGGEARCGIHSVVDSETGKPLRSVARPVDFGAMATMAAYVGRAAGDRSLEEWARRKEEFLWTHRLVPDLPLYADTYSPEGVVQPDEWVTSDTDTLYNVRRLYQLYEITGDRSYLDRALLVTDFWYERAWSPAFGHFVRKLAPDGTPGTDMLYGDSMYNTLWVLIHAHRYTGEKRYIDRVKVAWRNLVSMGEDGLVPRHVQRSGIWADRGLARNHANFVEILLEAYDASGDSELLCEAERYADTIMANEERALPNPPTRGSAGAALLRLAMARGPVDRLEVAVPGASRLRVESADRATLLDTLVDADLAVIYVPRGDYRLFADGKRVSSNK